MHPVVIMSYEKSPAINAAVEAIEKEGLEVIVLNTKTAKLVHFLGALAGEDGEDEKETKEEEPAEKEDVKKEPEEKVVDKSETKEKEEKEELVSVPESELIPSLTALVNGEEVPVMLVEGNGILLHAQNLKIGPKTTFSLNESTFGFWVDGLDEEELNYTKAIAGPIDLIINETQHLVMVSFSTTRLDKPLLMLGKNKLEELCS